MDDSPNSPNFPSAEVSRYTVFISTIKYSKYLYNYSAYPE